MILLVVYFLAIVALLTSIGLITFHVLMFVSKSKNIGENIIVSIVLSVPILLLLGQVRYNTYEIQLEKYFIFFAIIINQIMIFFVLEKTNKRT